MELQTFKDFLRKTFPKKEVPKLEPETYQYKQGEYVSRMRFEPYQEDGEWIEYAEIVGPYPGYPNMYIVQSLNGTRDVWYGDSMSRITELDAFLHTLEQ